MVSQRAGRWQPLCLEPLTGVGDAEATLAERMWQSSGAAALTDPAVLPPRRLIAHVAAMARWLDERGADLTNRTSSGGLGLLSERAQLMGLARSGKLSCGRASRFVRTADGWIVLALARPDDVELVPAWLETPVGSDPWVTIERSAAEASSTDLRDRAVLLGLPCAIIGERAADTTSVFVDQLGSGASRDVTGIRVVNLSALWAGPLASHLLRRLGASVIDVESTTRTDGARAHPKFYQRLHDGHSSVSLPFASQAGRAQLLELLESADVVIEGSRPRALEQLGIDAAEIVLRGPTVWVSITAHGRTGGHAERIGYGDDCAAAGGLIGFASGEPRFVADALADPITGIVSAVAATDLITRGGRWLVDVALARVAASMR